MSQRNLALLGASGYTGQLIVDYLRSNNLKCRLGGRNTEKIRSQIGDESNLFDIFEVDLNSEKSVDSFLDGIDTLMTTVGPFSTLGLPAAEGAKRCGTYYVDSTGEPHFISHIYENFNDSKKAMVPACGFDYILGDLAGAIASDDVAKNGDKVVSVDVLYSVKHMIPTRGTYLSALGAIANSNDAGKIDTLNFNGKTFHGLEVPWGENVMIARKLPDVKITSRLNVNPTIGKVVGFMTPIVRLGIPLGERLGRFVPIGPKPEKREKVEYEIFVTAQGKNTSSTVYVKGHDIYKSTAFYMVESALAIKGKGAISPSMALDPEPFLNYLVSKEESLSWERI